MKNYYLVFLFAFLLMSIFFVGKVNATTEEPYYDFYLEQISVSPSSPMAGQKCKIAVIFKNKGTKNVYSSDGFMNYEYDFGDFKIDSYTTPNPSVSDPIYPGETFQYYFEGEFPSAGAKVLSFDFKFYDYFYEENEDNNFKTKNLVVYNSSDMDLSVYEIEINEDEIIAGDDIEIRVTIKNTGKVSFTDGRGIMGDNVKLDCSGFKVSSYEVPSQPNIDNSFDPNEKLEYVYYGEFDRLGDQKINFYVDYNNEVAESIENNNQLSLTPYIYFDEEERDDFEIYDISYELISTSSVKILWKTTKTATSKVDYRIKYYTYDFTIDKDRVDSLDHEVIIEDLTPGEIYLYRVESTNNDVVKNSDYYEFTTPKENKVSIISGPTVDFLSEKNPKISWVTDVISQSYVFYKLNTGSSFIKKGSTSLVDEHAVDLGNLNFGLYKYYVISTSTETNIAYTSEIKTFEIKEVSEVDDSEEEDIPADEEQSQSEVSSEYNISNNSLYVNLKGKIILKVEQDGEAFYVHPENKKMYYLGRPDDAFKVMRELGLGISEKDYNNFKNNNNTAPSRLSGKIILRVEANGEAYYVNPNDLKMYYLGRPADAFNVMRELGLGISNSNFDKL